MNPESPASSAARRARPRRRRPVLIWIAWIGGAIVALLLLPVVVGMFLPKEFAARVRVRLKQPPEAVWAALADYRKLPMSGAMCRGVEELPQEGRQPAWREDIGKIPEDEREYELYYRLVALDPLNQRTTGEMRTLLFKDKQLVADETLTLKSNYYFRNEIHLLLEKAGFQLEAEKGDWTEADATAEHEVIVYFARK